MKIIIAVVFTTIVVEVLFLSIYPLTRHQRIMNCLNKPTNLGVEVCIKYLTDARRANQL